MVISQKRILSDLGACCICEGSVLIVDSPPPAGSPPGLISLPYRAPIPGRGWGCVLCGLPADGALAVLCGRCADRWTGDVNSLRFVCCGYPGMDIRVSMAEFMAGAESFGHDLRQHPEFCE